jgi:hypothetical protein
MADSHVVSGLVAKRGDLAGEAERHRRALESAGRGFMPPGCDDPAVRPGLRPWRHSGEEAAPSSPVVQAGGVPTFGAGSPAGRPGPLSDQGVTGGSRGSQGFAGPPRGPGVAAHDNPRGAAAPGGQGRGTPRRAGGRGAGLGAGVRAQAARRSGRQVLPWPSPHQSRCGRGWAHLVRMSVKIAPLDQRRVSSR